MDDFVLFDDDKAALHAARDRIEGWLWEQRRLRLNPRTGAVAGTSVPYTFLGYRVSRGGLEVGHKTRRRLARRVAIAAREGPAALERTLRAYRGIVMFGVE